MQLLRLVAALAVFAPALHLALTAQEPPPGAELVTHEWGTFTSVAGIDGAAVQWAPLSGTPDLPCFVNRLSAQNLKYAPGLVRMETPVLYFYSPRPLLASVSVQFPRGLITEWYPAATRVQPEMAGTKVPAAVSFKAQVDWDSIQVSPANSQALPTTANPSRYFAARNTDATPIKIGKQQEKFIFYRGMGYFDVALQARFLPDGGLQVSNTGAEPIALAIVFENHAGTIGYHVLHNLARTANVNPSELTGTVDSLRLELTDSLIEFGLYEKEALAMLDTWHDSWFEEGMRVFYIVPRNTVDSVLPLTITPQPSGTSRVFVGRVELLSPRVRQTITIALDRGDVDTLAKFGRFLNPFLEQIYPSSVPIQSPRSTEYLQQAYIKMEKELHTATCLK
jgi:hypothetical protein